MAIIFVHMHSDKTQSQLPRRTRDVKNKNKILLKLIQTRKWKFQTVHNYNQKICLPRSTNDFTVNLNLLLWTSVLSTLQTASYASTMYPFSYMCVPTFTLCYSKSDYFYSKHFFGKTKMLCCPENGNSWPPLEIWKRGHFATKLSIKTLFSLMLLKKPLGDQGTWQTWISIQAPCILLQLGRKQACQIALWNSAGFPNLKGILSPVSVIALSFIQDSHGILYFSWERQQQL